MWPALVLPLLLAAPPAPADFFGFRPDDDRVLADWNESVAFFRALDTASDRVAVEEIGKTTEGRPFLVVTITSPENFARIGAIRRDNLRLYDPRGLGEDEARELQRRYFLATPEFDPRVYWRITDNWLELTVRFVTHEHGVRAVKDAMSRDILKALDEAGIGIASATFEVVGLPTLRIRAADPQPKLDSPKPAPSPGG